MTHRESVVLVTGHCILGVLSQGADKIVSRLERRQPVVGLQRIMVSSSLKKKRSLLLASSLPSTDHATDVIAVLQELLELLELHPCLDAPV